RAQIEDVLGACQWKHARRKDRGQVHDVAHAQAIAVPLGDWPTAVEMMTTRLARGQEPRVEASPIFRVREAVLPNDLQLAAGIEQGGAKLRPALGEESVVVGVESV